MEQAAKPPRLLDRLREAIRVRLYSIRTEEAYVDWSRRFILFHNKRHPASMGAAEVNAFLSWTAKGSIGRRSQKPRLFRILPDPSPSRAMNVQSGRPSSLVSTLKRDCA